MASPSAGAPVLKYRDVNTETNSPGEVKGLIEIKKDKGILKEGKIYEINIDLLEGVNEEVWRNLI